MATRPRLRTFSGELWGGHADGRRVPVRDGLMLVRTAEATYRYAGRRASNGVPVFVIERSRRG